MKSWVIICFIFGLVLVAPVIYGLDSIPYGAGKCDTSFNDANITLKIYGTEPYKPYLIEETNGVYYFEIAVLGDKTKISEEIWGNLEVKCDHEHAGGANVDFDTYLKAKENGNTTFFVLNYTFLVPKGATFCWANAVIYGRKNNQSGICKNNCFCYIKGFNMWPHISTKNEKKEVWTREQFLMNKWAKELEKSNDEQKKQNERSMWYGIIGIIIGAFLTVAGTYYAQKKIYERRLMIEHNEKIYAPIQKSILFSIDKITNFLDIPNIEWNSDNFGNDYDYWTNIRNSPKSEMARAHDEKLFNQIDKFFEKLLLRYNQLFHESVKEATPLILKEISIIYGSETGFTNNSSSKPKKILSNILRKNCEEVDVGVLVHNQTRNHSEQITIALTKNELKKMKPKIEKLKPVKKLKQERQKILKEATEIKRQIEKYLKLN